MAPSAAENARPRALERDQRGVRKVDYPPIDKSGSSTRADERSHVVPRPGVDRAYYEEIAGLLYDLQIRLDVAPQGPEHGNQVAVEGIWETGSGSSSSGMVSPEVPSSLRHSMISVGYSSACSSSLTTGMILSSTNCRTALRISDWSSEKRGASAAQEVIAGV
jgi:hypothetical protein